MSLQQLPGDCLAQPGPLHLPSESAAGILLSSQDGGAEKHCLGMQHGVPLLQVPAGTTVRWSQRPSCFTPSLLFVKPLWSPGLARLVPRAELAGSTPLSSPGHRGRSPDPVLGPSGTHNQCYYCGCYPRFAEKEASLGHGMTHPGHMTLGAGQRQEPRLLGSFSFLYLRMPPEGHPRPENLFSLPLTAEGKGFIFNSRAITYRTPPLLSKWATRPSKYHPKHCRMVGFTRTKRHSQGCHVAACESLKCLNLSGLRFLSGKMGMRKVW